MSGDPYRLSAVALDSRAKLSSAAADECAVTIRDLVTQNRFCPVGSPGGPYHLTVGVEDNRLILNLFLEDGTPHGTAYLSISPYRRIVREYGRLCESFAMAEGGGCTPDQIEALDMARRSLHDEGAKLLRERLAGKVEMDLDTARGLFGLIYLVLQKE